MKANRQGSGRTRRRMRLPVCAMAGLLLAGRVLADDAAPFPPEALAASIRILQTGDEVDCLREASRLEKAGTPALPALFIGLTNRNPIVRNTAWRAIDRIGLPADIGCVDAALRSADALQDPVEQRRLIERVAPVLEELYAADRTNVELRLRMGFVWHGLAATCTWRRETNLLERAADLLGGVYREKGECRRRAGAAYAAAEETLGSFNFRGDKQKAHVAYEAAREVWRAFATDDPGIRMYQAEYLLLSCKSADCLWHSGRTGEAVRIYGEVESGIAAMTNRDEIWWIPAAGLAAAYEVLGARAIADHDFPAAGRLLATAREMAERRVSACPDSSVGVPLACLLNQRSADLCVLEDRLDRAEPFLARVDAVLRSPDARTTLPAGMHAQMTDLLHRFRAALETLDKRQSWYTQDPARVAAAFHALGEIAAELGYGNVTYAYARNEWALRERLASNPERRYHDDLFVATMNVAVLAEALQRRNESVALASNALRQADALLETSSRTDREVVLRRVCALALLARRNDAAGLAEAAQHYRALAVAAMDECGRSGLLSNDDAAVLRQSCSASAWQEPWPPASGSAIEMDTRGHAAYTHWEGNWWMRATQAHAPERQP